MKTSNVLKSIEKTGDYLSVKTEGIQFQVYFLDENIIRLRGTFSTDFAPESSYALVKTAWKDNLDELMSNERTRCKAQNFTLEQTATGYTAKSTNYNLLINADPFCFSIVDKAGNVLHQDLAGRAFVQNELGQSFHYSRRDSHNKYYGFGEKSGLLNKAKRRMRMHNVDALGYDGEKSDPLYKMIPFYINFDSNKNIAHGMFYNNSYDSAFDMGCEHSNYWSHYSYFVADGGDIDLFFIGGSTIANVVQHYTNLTGKSAMMPLASLGYMGSTMYYTELDKNSDEAILNFIDTCQNEEIPIDGFFLSSGYTAIEGKRYVFNWNHTRFPNPQQFVNELTARGVLLAPNIKPGMLLSHPLLEKFTAADAYIKTADGKAFQTDKYWGGEAHFVDFTNSAGRNTWSKYLNEQLLSLGIYSLWNDNNEYEINDGTALTESDGLKLPIASNRPIMPTLMCKTGYDAVINNLPNVRPYMVSRAGFAGIQRYAQTWAGDNATNWTNLKYNVATVLGMGLSGVANQGCDIGGFDGSAPSPELFVRWVQNGIFQPRFSIHSCNTDNTITEPWMYPSFTKYIRDAIQLRYSLAPYFYSLLHESATLGSPIMRPLVYEFQEDSKVHEESFNFMLGQAILVANVLEVGQTLKDIYLPKGSSWYDLKTYKYYQGGQSIQVDVDLDSIPMFLRSGSIVVSADNLMNLHNDVISHLHITIEPSSPTEFTLYEDDGKTLNYKNGESLLTKIAVAPSHSKVEINFKEEGNYKSTVKNFTINLLCPKIAPLNIKLQEQTIPRFLVLSKFIEADFGWYYDGEKKQAIIKLPKPATKEFSVYVENGIKDLISI
ncbi:MAG: DUF4968 domain-containing protein [Alphaproteobacteria bacterium]|jgi:alpha-glucosidase|nr:DUF4968 domain-containing protein [Alphaproteobacteria bacterium]